MNLQFCKMTCLQRKIQRKCMQNLIKYQVENCPTLPWWNLISTCNRRVKSLSAGRGEIHPGKPGSCNHYLRYHTLRWNSSDFQKFYTTPDSCLLNLASLSQTASFSSAGKDSFSLSWPAREYFPVWINGLKVF